MVATSVAVLSIAVALLLPRRSRALELAASVAPPGSVLVLRPPRALTKTQRDELSTWRKRTVFPAGVEVVVIEPDWDAVVIGGPK